MCTWGRVMMKSHPSCDSSWNCTDWWPHCSARPTRCSPRKEQDSAQGEASQTVTCQYLGKTNRIKIDIYLYWGSKTHYLDIWWDTTNKEHYILGVKVKQWVSAWSFAFLDELLLVCGALTRDGQEDFSMSSQSVNRGHKDVLCEYKMILTPLCFD